MLRPTVAHSGRYTIYLQANVNTPSSCPANACWNLYSSTVLQDHNIPIASVSADLATEKNLQGLVKIGENLLQRPLSKDDCKINHGRANAKSTLTYADLLTRFAKLLSDERKFRLQNIELDARVLANHERWALQNTWSMPILAIRVDYYKQLCVLHVLECVNGKVMC